MTVAAIIRILRPPTIDKAPHESLDSRLPFPPAGNARRHPALRARGDERSRGAPAAECAGQRIAARRRRQTKREFRALQGRVQDEHGQRHGGRAGHRLPGGGGHVDRSPEGLGRCAAGSEIRQGGKRAGRRGSGPQSHGRGVDLLCRLFQDQRRRRPPRDVSLQRRSGLIDHVAAHGRVRAAAYRHLDGCAYAGGALFDREQQFEPARCERPGVHRRTRRGLQPHRRQGQGEGVLRDRSGRLRLRRVHLAVPHQVRPLEFAEVSVRGELRHPALRGAHQPVRGRARRRFQRGHPVVANPELRSEPGPPDRQPRHRCTLRDRAAHLCGDRLVSPQAARGASGPSRTAHRGRAIRDGRLRAGARGRIGSGRCGAQRRRAETAWLHGTPRRLHPEGELAHRWRRIPSDARGR